MPRVPKAGNIPLMAGLLDMAILFDVSPRTPTTWFRRGELPPEDVIISGKCRSWTVSRLEVWAANTDRLPIYPDRLREARRKGEHIQRRATTGRPEQVTPVKIRKGRKVIRPKPVRDAS